MTVMDPASATSASQPATSAPSRAPHLVSLGPATEFPDPSMRMTHADGKRLLVITTSQGRTVTDNACPHEGYGLTTGELSDGTLTCSWHNWKYRVADGHCLVGEEDLRVYPCSVDDQGMLVAEVVDPEPAVVQARLLPSLRRGLDDGYVGQMSRDIVRLLRADADPVQLVWEAVAWGLPRAEFGFGHAMASLVDCLAAAETLEGDARALPVAKAFAGIAETERRRPLRPRPASMHSLPSHPGAVFRAMVESEELDAAEALLCRAIAEDYGPEELKGWLIGIVSDHHLGYGHASIYVQKAFQLLELLGWDKAGDVLPHLVPSIGYSTRADKLPYMRRFVRGLAGLDLGALAGLAMSADGDGGDHDGGARLSAAMDSSDGDELAAAIGGFITAGGSVDALLDLVVDSGSRRLLSYDPSGELSADNFGFGWLDMTHVLTYANSARWAWHQDPGVDALRLAAWTAFLAQYSGRKGYTRLAPGCADPVPAVTPSRPEAVAEACLGDHAGAFIHAAHLVKTTTAALSEHQQRGAQLPLRAVARLIDAPRRESSVAVNVRRALMVADGRIPPD